MLAVINAAETAPYVLAVFLTFAAAIVLVVAFDLLADDSTKAWRRLAEMRGYARPRSRLEKIATRASFVRRIQESFDLARLLAIAGRDESALAFLGKAVFTGLGAAAAILFLDGLYASTQGGWLLGLPPYFVVVIVWFGATMIMIMDLRGEVKKRRENAGKSLGDMLMLVAIMTDGRGLQLEDAVRILSRCVQDPNLEAIIDKRGWQRVIREPYRNTIELFRLIGEEYGIPVFLMVADAAANANVGFQERDTYTRLAKTLYDHRLTEAKIKAARAKIMVTIPVAGMLFPLLILLGAPTFASIAQGLSK